MSLAFDILFRSLFRSIKLYLYSPYSQIKICLTGLNKVRHPLPLTLNNKEKLSKKHTCEGSLSWDGQKCDSVSMFEVFINKNISDRD